MKKSLILLGMSLLTACGVQKTELPLLPAEAFQTTVDGKPVALYTLHAGDITMQVTNYGARVVSLWTPDREDRYEDIVLGYENIGRYIDNTGERFLGAVVGPYANRIAKGRFTLDGTEYTLPLNNNGQTLHGGLQGVDRVVWDVVSATDDKLVLHYLHPDGQDGFPGNLDIEMTYSLTPDNEFRVDYKATTDKPYSIDDNLWGRAIECGVLEDPWCEPPADIWTMTCDPACAPDEPTYVEIEFDQGVPCALDGTPMSFLDIIYAMNDIAGSNGFGRIDMVENRLVGVKSRECYEVPGGLALIQAHKALEDLCLERGVLHHKLAIEQTWAEQVYNGLWFSPLKEAFDAFLAHTQQCVTGTVKLKFFKGSCTVVGRKSTYSLYDFGLATYDADDAFDHQAAKGFIDIHGLSCKVWAKNRLATGARMPSYDDVDLTKTAYGKTSAVVEAAEEILEDADAVTA